MLNRRWVNSTLVFSGLGEFLAEPSTLVFSGLTVGSMGTLNTVARHEIIRTTHIKSCIHYL